MKKEFISTKINVKENSVRVMRVGNIDYISLTDLARFKNDKNPSNVIIHWLSNKDTALYVGLWEELNNENFNFTEYSKIKIDEIGTSSYTMSPKQWIKRTNAIGLIAKGGKYSMGTYAHPDLAFEFASWLSVEFKFYLIKEFERLKKNENYQNEIEWSVRRELAKTNYKIHTDSIRENLVPKLAEKQRFYAYANEADILNVALFGMTSKEWKEKNPTLKGNIRDYANTLQLVILINLENLNSEMIAEGLEQDVRIERLNAIAKKQYSILQENNGIKRIESIEKDDDPKKIE
jgi:hypothetical protein